MKIKPRSSKEPSECCVVGCHEKWEAFGFCAAHRAELNEAFEKNKWWRKPVEDTDVE